MQAIAAIVADLLLLATSLVIITNNVKGILARAAYIAVVTGIALFVAAYTATCVNKGRCEWTKQEFKEVAYCTLRPDHCTELIPKFADMIASEYWRRQADQNEKARVALEQENQRLRREKEMAEATTARTIEEKRQAEQQVTVVTRQPAPDPVHQLQQEPAKPDGLTWIFQNNYGYKISVRFFSTTRLGYVWPEQGRVFVLDHDGPIPLRIRCNPGEQICYGAWPTGNESRAWGVGPTGKNGCERCCSRCGDPVRRLGLR